MVDLDALRKLADDASAAIRQAADEIEAARKCVREARSMVLCRKYGRGGLPPEFVLSDAVQAYDRLVAGDGKEG